MTEVAIVDPKNFGIEAAKAKEIQSNLPQIISERSELEKQFNEVIKMDIKKPETWKEARELRLLIQKNRTQGINKWHATNKDVFLRGGQYVDAIKRREIQVNERMEKDLAEIEKYEEIQEQKRLAELQNERAKELSPYVENAAELDLSGMECDVWEAYFQTKKKAFEDEQEAIKKAEEERKECERVDSLKNKREIELRPYYQFVPENHPNFGELSESEWDDFLAEMKNAKEDYDKEQERIREENERLYKEAEEKGRLAKIEAEKREEEEKRQKALDKAGENRRELLFNIGVSLDFQSCRDMDEKEWNYFYKEKMDKFQAEQNRLHLQKIKEEKERKEQEAKLLAEQKKAEEQRRIDAEKARKLAAELKAKEEAEQKAKEEEAAKLQAELNKGDADKVKDLISDLQKLKEKYSFKSQKNKKMYQDVKYLLDKVVTHIESK